MRRIHMGVLSRTKAFSPAPPPVPELLGTLGLELETLPVGTKVAEGQQRSQESLPVRPHVARELCTVRIRCEDPRADPHWRRR